MKGQCPLGFTLVVAMAMAFVPAGCGCGGRTTLSAAVADAGQPKLDGSFDDRRPDWGSSGGSGGTAAGGADGGGKDGAAGAGGAVGGAGAGGAGTGGPGIGGGGAGGTGGGGKGGAAATGGAGNGGMATGGIAGAPATGGIGSGGFATGGRSSGVGSGGRGTGGLGAGGAATGGSGTGGTDAGGGDGGADAGPPLWRSSYQPFCQKEGGTYPIAMGVWSDARGVFVLVYDAKNPPALWSNLGTGWQAMYTWPKGTVASSAPAKIGLKGFVGGPLITYGVQPCWIQLVDGNGATCSGAAREIADVAPVSANLAYAAYADRLLRFDGSFWTQLGDPLPTMDRSEALWADSSTIALVADKGNVYLIESEGKPVPQSGLPSVDFTAVWGAGGKDIWIGSRDGQLFHYDGATWTLVATLPADGYGVIKLWGADGHVFAITSTAFARWDGTRVDTIESTGGDSIYKDLWGNSAKEVFVTRYYWNDEECGAFQARWFDGSVVGRL